ncbi:uncharacterized protein IL334_004625 [Kwoniella shivajii]|uniref:Uncharacterized protein n=1 Tax=Kwoniella shivajii TaxID=564305 RepID=A0ABZ1D107_9TREE|nr:hypothetical protein IL334_004625 [Kwoniella shivajii]
MDNATTQDGRDTQLTSPESEAHTKLSFKKRFRDIINLERDGGSKAYRSTVKESLKEIATKFKELGLNPDTSAEYIALRGECRSTSNSTDDHGVDKVESTKDRIGSLNARLDSCRSNTIGIDGHGPTGMSEAEWNKATLSCDTRLHDTIAGLEELTDDGLFLSDQMRNDGEEMETAYWDIGMTKPGAIGSIKRINDFHLRASNFERKHDLPRTFSTYLGDSVSPLSVGEISHLNATTRLSPYYSRQDMLRLTKHCCQQYTNIEKHLESQKVDLTNSQELSDLYKAKYDVSFRSRSNMSGFHDYLVKFDKNLVGTSTKYGVPLTEAEDGSHHVTPLAGLPLDLQWLMY